MARHPTPVRTGETDQDTAWMLPHEARSAAWARRLIRDQLSRWDIDDDALVSGAALVTSELVTNALVHTAGNGISCRIAVKEDLLHLEVTDLGSEESDPRLRVSDDNDGFGRGLLLVKTHSVDWGVCPAPDGGGQTVWAELPLTDRSGHQ